MLSRTFHKLSKHFFRIFPLHSVSNYQFATQTKKSTNLPSFNNYKFIPEIVKFVETKDILTPSPIQQLTFNYFSENNNKKPMFIGGPTGSGKTLAFLIPILNDLKRLEIEHNLHGALPNRPSAIVLCPSKELINQIHGVAKNISHFAKLKIEKVETSANWKRAKDTMKEGLDVLVTNPNKLSRLTREKHIHLSNLKYLVIDEADVFIESGEEEVLIQIIKETYLQKDEDEKVQLIFVSATLTPSLRIFLDKIFKQNIKFLLSNDTHFNLANLNHEFLPVQNNNKLEMLSMELKKFEDKKNEFYFIVFCNSMNSVRAIDYYLKDQGFNCGSLHSDMPIRLRAETFENFRDKKTNVLVCTDLAARGLDFVHLLGVVNFDFPKNVNDYIHRAGRAGRIGNKGHVISFYKNMDLELIDQLRQSNDKGIPLELTQSSFALKKTKRPDETGLDKNRFSESKLPEKYRGGVESNRPLTPGLRRTSKYKPIKMKLKPNFARRKIISIKKSIKKEVKLVPNSKRSKYLKREIKNIHKEELVRKGKLQIPDWMKKRIERKKQMKH